MKLLKMLGLSCLAATFSGATPAPPAVSAVGETRPAEAKPSRYMDGIQGFSVGVPGSVQRAKERTVVASFQVGVDDGFVSNINVIVDPIKTTRDEYMEKSLAELKTTNPNAVYKRRDQVEVSG